MRHIAKFLIPTSILKSILLILVKDFFMAVRLHCWWCCHPWDGPDVHLPFAYDPKTKKFETKGHYCSFECAKADALDRAGPRYGEVLEYLALMRKHALGKYVPLWPAPKRQALQIFGGTLTIEEFRKRASTAPWVHEPGDIHRFHTITDVHKAGEQTAAPGELKLERKKPLKRAESKLESALKLKKKDVCS